MRFGPYFAMLIKEFERKGGKIILKAHYDSGGVLTGPEGMTFNPDGSPIRENQTWTEAQALQIAADIYEPWARDIWEMIEPNIRPQLKPHMFDALGFFSINIGRAQFKRSTTLTELNAGRFEQAAAGMLLYYRDRLKGGKTGPDGKPARDPHDNVMPEGQSWFKAFRGLLRRQIWTALLFMGLNWRNPAVGYNKIVLAKQPVWRGDKEEWYDEIIHMTRWKDVLADVQGDPMPVLQSTSDDVDDELFDPEPVTVETVKISGRDVSLPSDWSTWSGADQVEWLNEQSNVSLGGDPETPGPDPVKAARIVGAPGDKPLSPNSLRPDEVPYGVKDPNEAGSKPFKEAGRVKTHVAQKKALETAVITTTLGTAATGASQADKVTAYFEKYPPETILLAMGSILGIVALFMGVRWLVNVYREYESEKRASQLMH